MKIIAQKNNLLKALSRAQGVVEKRTTVPILSYVLLEATDRGLTISATDMDLGFKETVSAQIEEHGATTVSAFMLYDIVRKLEGDADVTVTLDGEQNRLEIESGRSTFKLGTLPVSEFTPVKAGDDLPHTFSMPVETLRRMLDCTRSAMSTDETRYYLNGIYLHTHERDGVLGLRAVATDGHRLAVFDTVLPDNAEAIPGIIIGRKAVTEMRKLVEQGEGDVKISLSGTQISVNFDDAILTSRLVEGTYPSYQHVIPVANDNSMLVDTQAFADAVDRVALLSSEKSKAIKLKIEANCMTLSALNADHGSAVEEMEVEYTATPVSMGFNPRYLLDVTQQMRHDQILFRLADSATPIIMNDQGENNATFVLMPMRV